MNHLYHMGLCQSRFGYGNRALSCHQLTILIRSVDQATASTRWWYQVHLSTSIVSAENVLSYSEAFFTLRSLYEGYIDFFSYHYGTLALLLISNWTLIKAVLFRCFHTRSVVTTFWRSARHKVTCFLVNWHKSINAVVSNARILQ